LDIFKGCSNLPFQFRMSISNPPGDLFWHPKFGCYWFSACHGLS
jgi:hypothetical protein